MRNCPTCKQLDPATVSQIDREHWLVKMAWRHVSDAMLTLSGEMNFEIRKNITDVFKELDRVHTFLVERKNKLEEEMKREPRPNDCGAV